MLFFMLLPGIGPDKLDRSIAEAFAWLYEEFVPKVFRYVSYRVGDIHLAEDLTSAVFEKALARFKSYDPQKAGFSTWIFSIARNALIDHFRVSSRRPTLNLDSLAEVGDGNPSPEDAFVRAEERRKLRACIARLPLPEQEIISLKFGAEMTNRQIAGLLGLTESNVGVIVYRSVRKLRDGFGEQEHD
ncbi:MAG: sigma-70 family RNA polymerase sigma factor [Dehalococcoidia bacterium]|nr:sigma-70 family RNA polymerase sigma factor [Dehalococcoidia bacterium]